MPKLKYFYVQGRAASLRMLLKHAKADFEDGLVAIEDWGAHKASGEFPNNQLPVICHDGRVFNESLATLRMFGKIHRYYPEDKFVAWDTDATVDYCNEYIASLVGPHKSDQHSDESKKAYAEQIQKFCTFFEKKLEQGGSTFINSDKLTIGDFQLAAIIFTYVLNEHLGGDPDYTSVG